MRGFLRRPGAAAWAVAIACALTGPAAAQDAAASAPTPAASAARAGLLEATVARVELLSRSDPAAARRLAEEALARQPGPDLEARLRLQLCDYYIEHDRQAVPALLARLQALLPQLQRRGLQAGVLACEGQWRESAGENIAALALYDQAVGAAEAARDDEAQADALYLRGYLLGVVGEYGRSLADLQRAQGLYERLRKPVQARATLSGVATVYSRMGDHDQARRYFEDVLAALPDTGPSRERVINLHLLGGTELSLGHWDHARERFEQVLAQSRALDYPLGQAQGLRGLATAFNALDQPQRALAHAEQAEQLVGNAAEPRLRAHLQLQRGAALRRLRRQAEALPLLRSAVELFQRSQSVAEEGKARDELAQALADGGEWRAAYEQQVQARRIAETLLARQRDQRFASMKVQFDTEVKVKENALLTREKEAGERALAEQRRASRLQIVAVGLASALALSLGGLAWRQRGTSRQMRDLAMTDELTGLPNRRQSMRELARVLLRPAADGALLILDIDRFKPINDRHGHAIGDEVLKLVTEACRAQTGPGMVFGRLGGEEFLLVLEHGTLEAGVALAERLRQAVAALDVRRWLSDRGVTVSIGVTALQAGDAASAALARADRALYRAKANGRNRVEVEGDRP